MQYPLIETHDPIDAVITWVDGTAPEHLEARQAFMSAQSVQLHENARNPHRWVCNDEISYCLRSIATHAPWLRKIWIVAERGTPSLDGLPAAFRKKIALVSHREIFGEFQSVLPTFNSLAIESMLWRIEGLAERFLYFNDDVFLTSNLNPDDVFRGPMPVLRGKWVDYNDLVENSQARDDPAKFNHFMQINAARLCGFDASHLFSSAHVVHPLRRSVMHDLFDAHRAAFLANIAHRFRDLAQFLPQGLHNHACIAKGDAVIHAARDHCHIKSGQGLGRPVAETWSLLHRAAHPNVKFLCINDLPQLEQVIPDARVWLHRTIGSDTGNTPR
jgi:hypothetical protein